MLPHKSVFWSSVQTVPCPDISFWFETLCTSEETSFASDIEEADFSAVPVLDNAAASVLARYTFLRELNKLSNKYSFNFLKGAGPEVDRTAISFVKGYGWDALNEVAKMKFANTSRLREYFTQNPLPKSKQGKLNAENPKE